MKTEWLILLIAFTFLGGRSIDKESWIIDTRSRITIHGSTNVNDFACKLDCYLGKDTLQYRKGSSCDWQLASNAMTIPIISFDCNSKQITRDFCETLKSETYPNLHIKFVSLQNPFTKGNSAVKGVTDITLAGVTTRYTIQYDVKVDYNNTLLLTGTRSVTFSDFNLQAPEKFSGLIKVKDDLKVEFNLVLRAI